MKQNVVARSTSEAEYRDMTLTTCEVMAHSIAQGTWH